MACIVITVGIISDTHGLLRPEAIVALAGTDHIIHAGDIGSPEVVRGLRQIAPVTAIRGNVDRGSWTAAFPENVTIEVGGQRVHVLHNRRDFDPESGADCDVVVSGHSHKPDVDRIGDVLYVNPGSAGPRRFSLPVAVALLSISSGAVNARIVALMD